MEYHLGGLEPYYPTTIECGRASIIKEHLHIATLFMLWRGISLYLKLKGHRYVIGCCSLTSQIINGGSRSKKRLRKDGVLSEDVWLNATDEYSCGDPSREFDEDLGRPLKIPRLFNAYIKLGAKVVSEPAIDRYFKTIDFLILLDAAHIIRPETIELHRFKLILANRLAPGE